MEWIIAIIFMIILSVYDIWRKEIPVFWLILFASASLVYVVFAGESGWLSIIYSLIPGALLLTISLCTRESIGYGDGWTVLALGVLIGLWECFAVVFAGLIFSAIFSLILLVLRRVNGKSRLPFLPFITIGLGVVTVVQSVF